MGTQNIITNRIIFKGEGLDTLEKQLSSVRQEISRITAAHNIVPSDLLSREKALADQRAQMLATESRGRERALQEEQRIRSTINKMEVAEQQKILDAKASQNRAYNDQYFRDIEQNSQRMSRMLQAQWEQRVKYEKETGDLGNYSHPEMKEFTKIAGYRQQLSAMNKECESLYKTWRQTGDVADKVRFDKAALDFSRVSKEVDDFNKRIGISSDKMSMLGTMATRVKSNLEFMAAAMATAALTAIPVGIEETLKETDKWTQKIKQNLELSDKYKGNMQQLNADVKHLQEVASIYAVGYGSKVDETLESLSILSRRFKDTGTLTYLENLVQTIAKLDNVPMKETSEKLEAVILQFGLDAKQSKDFVNQFSVAVHSGRITGQELLDGLQRSGSSFHSFNMGTKEAISLITAMSTVTARSGSTMGLVFRGIISQLETGTKKTREVFDKLGISMYTTNQKGVQTLKDGATIFGELLKKYNELDDHSKNIMAEAISGGKMRINEVRALLDQGSVVYQQMNEALEKASDEQTAELLKTSMESYATNVTRVTAALQTLGMHIGNDVLPALTQLCVGLTAGIMWLDENRETVEKLIGVLGRLGVAMLLMRTNALTFAGGLLASAAAGARTDAAIVSLIAKEDGFKAAFAAMGASASSAFMTMATAATVFLLRLGAIYAAILACEYAYENFIKDGGVRGDAKTAWMQRDIAQQRYDNMQNGVDYQGNPVEYTQEEKDKLNDDLWAKEQNASAIQEKVDKADNADNSEAMAKAQAQADAAMEEIQAKQAASMQELMNKIDSSAKQPTLDTMGSGGAGGSGGNAPADASAGIEHQEDMLEFKELNNTTKQIKDKYDMLRKIIENQEKQYGVTERTADSMDKTYNDEIWALNYQLGQMQELENKYNQKLNGIYDGSTPITSIDSSAGDGVVAIADSHPEREQWMGNITSDPSIQCDSFTANVYNQAGISSIGGVDTASSAINDSAFSAANAFHPVGDGYNPQPGDLVSFAGHVGIYVGNDEIISRQSSMGVHRASISEAESYFGAVQGYGSIGEITGSSSGVPLPNNLQDYISQTDWNGLDVAGKREFLENHRQELNNVKEIIANTKSALDVDEKKAELIKEIRDIELQRQEKKFQESEGIISQLVKDEEYRGTTQRWKSGLGITKPENDQLDIDKAQVEYNARVKELAKYQPDTLQYKQMNEKIMNLEMQLNSAKVTKINDEYSTARSNDDYNKKWREASNSNKYKGISESQEEGNEAIKEEQQHIEELKRKLDELAKVRGATLSQEYKNTQLELHQAYANMQKLQSAYTDKLREGSYKLADDLLLKGNSLRDIWKKLWNDLAEDALKALFRINNGGNVGFLAQLLGFGKTSSSSVSSGYNALSGGGFFNLVGLFHANGGVVNSPSIAGEDGEEVIIPVEKNLDNSQNLLSYAAKRLGTSTQVHAELSEGATRKAEGMAAAFVQTQQDMRHLGKLDTQIELMQRQNEMMLHMINNGMGGSGGNTIMQPVVVSQQMDGTQFADMYSRAQRMRTIK